MKILSLLLVAGAASAYTVPRSSRSAPPTFIYAESAMRMTQQEVPDPRTFREAEVLGLRLMQEGSFEEALVGRF